MTVVVHELKCWPEPFSAVKYRLKTHEVRKNDRDFKVGDELLLREWHPVLKEYSGDSVRVKITYITAGGTFGLPPDVCVLSIKRIPPKP